MLLLRLISEKLRHEIFGKERTSLDENCVTLVKVAGWCSKLSAVSSFIVSILFSFSKISFVFHAVFASQKKKE